MKSHLGDPRALEFGKTQVRAGRIAARTRSGLRYWIAHVSNVADARQIRIEMIPNLLSEAGEAVLELLGRGPALRLQAIVKRAGSTTRVAAATLPRAM